MAETVYVASINSLQDASDSKIEVFSNYQKAVVYVIESMEDVWTDENGAEIMQFINEDYWLNTEYEVTVYKKHIN